jgi:hypothetical protein
LLWEEIRYSPRKEKEILTEEGTDLGRKQQKRKERRDMATDEGCAERRCTSYSTDTPGQ